MRLVRVARARLEPRRGVVPAVVLVPDGGGFDFEPHDASEVGVGVAVVEDGEPVLKTRLAKYQIERKTRRHHTNCPYRNKNKLTSRGC